MAEKKKRNVDEEVIRYIYNSRFYPEKLIDEKSEYKIPRNYRDDKIFGLIDRAKSFTEARNLLIDGLKDEDNLRRARDFAKAYLIGFGTPDEPYDSEKAFLAPMEKIPLNVDALPYEVVESKGDDIAKALQYTAGMASMIEHMNQLNKMAEYRSLFDRDGYKPFIASEISKKLENDDAAKAALLKILDLTPNADANYIAEKAADYATRVKTKKKHDAQGSLSRSVESFLLPREEKKSSEGKPFSALDFILDLAEIGGVAYPSAKFGRAQNTSSKIASIIDNIPAIKNNGVKLGKAIDLTGLGVISGVAEPFLTRFNDVVDALANKNVYAHEGDSDEVSERGDIGKALRLGDLPSDVGTGMSNGLKFSLAGQAGRLGSKAASKIGEKIASSNVGKKVMNALDEIFQGKINNKPKKAFKDLIEEKKLIEDKIKDGTTNINSKVNAEAVKQYEKRLDQINRHQGAFEKAYEKSGGNAARTALDALLASYVIKSGIDPDMNARKSLKDAFAIDFLLGE